MKGTAIQVMFFCEHESEEKKIHNFLKKYQGKLLISIPIKVPARKKC
jgi:hypothetical protein